MTKVCPQCRAQLAPQVAVCQCGFSWQQPAIAQPLAAHETRCLACMSVVTKGMRCIRCGVLAKSQGISKGTISGVVIAIVLLVVCSVIWSLMH